MRSAFPDLYSERPNLYIGFHGCDKENGMALIERPNEIRSSTADHEWLGKGFYVWENNQDRALDWAKNHLPKPFKSPFVIGVVYTLGNCLDLTDMHFIDLLADDFECFRSDCTSAGIALPKNAGPLRKLDCAVIEHFHDASEHAADPIRYDTVRGAFYEGEPAYEGTEIKKKNHIQVCIRNMNRIKGFFLPRG